MHDYSELRRRHSQPVSQTLDQPVMILDTWELWEAGLIVGWMVLFGAILSNWWLMFVLVVGSGYGLPQLRKHYPKGKVFHFLYAEFHLPLAGLIAPLGQKRLSD